MIETSILLLGFILHLEKLTNKVFSLLHAIDDFLIIIIFFFYKEVSYYRTVCLDLELNWIFFFNFFYLPVMTKIRYG